MADDDFKDFKSGKTVAAAAKNATDTQIRTQKFARQLHNKTFGQLMDGLGAGEHKGRFNPESLNQKFDASKAIDPQIDSFLAKQPFYLQPFAGQIKSRIQNDFSNRTGVAPDKAFGAVNAAMAAPDPNNPPAAAAAPVSNTPPGVIPGSRAIAGQLAPQAAAGAPAMTFFDERGAHSTVGGKNQPTGYYGIMPQLRDRLQAAAQAYETQNPGRRAQFGEATRDVATQQQYWAARGNRYDPLHPAARPGFSQHQSGGAMDIPDGHFLDWMHQNAGQYGLVFPVKNDSGHVQAAGVNISGYHNPQPIASNPLGNPELKSPAVNDLKNQVVNQWRQAGMSDNGIAGILRNIDEESSWNPSLRHPDQPKYTGEAHYAHGLYQDGGPEWGPLQLYAQQQGKPWTDPGVQTGFVISRVKGTPLWDQLNSAPSGADAATSFVRGYLKPKPEYQANRIAGFQSNPVKSVQEQVGEGGGALPAGFKPATAANTENLSGGTFDPNAGGVGQGTGVSNILDTTHGEAGTFGQQPRGFEPVPVKYDMQGNPMVGEQGFNPNFSDTGQPKPAEPVPAAQNPMQPNMTPAPAGAGPGAPPVSSNATPGVPTDTSQQQQPQQNKNPFSNFSLPPLPQTPPMQMPNPFPFGPARPYAPNTPQLMANLHGALALIQRLSGGNLKSPV